MLLCVVCCRLFVVVWCVLPFCLLFVHVGVSCAVLVAVICSLFLLCDACCLLSVSVCGLLFDAVVVGLFVGCC